MSYNHQELQSQIMGRVGAIYITRKIVEPGLLFPASAAIFGALYVLSVVSIRNVIWNMPSITDFDAFFAFYQSAILNTEGAVQVSVFFVAGALLFLMLRILKLPTLRLA